MLGHLDKLGIAVTPSDGDDVVDPELTNLVEELVQHQGELGSRRKVSHRNDVGRRNVFAHVAYVAYPALAAGRLALTAPGRQDGPVAQGGS